MIIRKIFFQEKEPPINTMWVDPTGEDVKIKIYDTDVEEWKVAAGTSTDPEEGITPASIGAYTKGEVDTLLAAKAFVTDIPTVNDSTVTIQKNGVDVDSFTLDASEDKTIDISVPTALSELSDDSTHRLVSDTDISAWTAKQDTISDLTSIRSGASLGSTAYQKPSTGIPKTDLSQEVQNALDSPSITSETDPVFTASPAYNITSSNISSWNAKQDVLTFDTTPTANSTNPVTSAGIKAYVDNATPTITMDDTPTSGSNNPVKSGGIYTALQGKQNTLTFDSTPTASSTNPVTSGGVKTALDLKANQSTTYSKTEVDALFDDVAYLGDDDGQATTLDFDPQADTVWNIPQTLGSSQQAQARANIGVVDVSGTNDGTNWTSITIGSTTKAIPAGGGGSGDENVIEGIKMNNTSLTPDANKVVDLGTVITSHQDISGKADKSEMGVSASGDQTTITLKSGTSATVINAHQSLTGKQDVLVSGTNIKTINNESLLGSGNITISGGGGGETNVIESISINGTTQTVTNKNVDLPVPTSSTITAIVSLTEAQYTALATKDSSTLYVILES